MVEGSWLMVEARPSPEQPSAHQPCSLGLIAGNGRFPFLVLEAARGAGHDVTLIAIKEEAFPGLADLAARPPATTVHWVSLGSSGNASAC